MTFKAPHVSFVSFAVEISPTDTADVMVVEFRRIAISGGEKCGHHLRA